jgi:DnaJ-class molecular chaperone
MGFPADMRQIAAAHEVLSDETKRSAYDGLKGCEYPLTLRSTMDRFLTRV